MHYLDTNQSSQNSLRSLIKYVTLNIVTIILALSKKYNSEDFRACPLDQFFGFCAHWDNIVRGFASPLGKAIHF
jgi:hypothetical protein